MLMKHLASNSELLSYLQALSKIFEERRAEELSEAVNHVGRMSLFMSTEFLGESRIVLKKVLKKGRSVLTREKRDDVKEVLAQIDWAFDRKRYQR